MNDPLNKNVNQSGEERLPEGEPQNVFQNEPFSDSGSEICSAEFAEGCILNDEDV